MSQTSASRHLKIASLSPATVALLGGVFWSCGANAGEASVPGTTLTYKTYIEGEGGYDSNPDSLFDHVGTAFERVEGSFKVKSETPTESYELTLKSRDIQFNNLDDSNRWDAKAALDGTFVAGAGQKLSAGSYYLRDFVALDKLDIVHSYAEYAVTGDEYRVKLEARSHVEHNIGEDVIGPKQPQDDFDVSKGEAFDYARTDGRVSAIFMTKSMLQPFMIYDFGDVNYYNQVSGASIDRDARDQFGIAGVRFEFDKTFRVDVAGRINHREFDDVGITSFTRGFVDINAYWQPTDSFKATLVIERFLKEPATSFGLADDDRAVGLTADWQIDPQWRMSWAGYYDRVDAIGDEVRYNKYSTLLSLTYEPNKNYEIFVSGLGKWVTEEVSGDSYSRYKIGSGVRFKF
jgi:Putative beta-barrel porin 2